MEIFKHNIKFNSWGEIYAGLKRDFIGAEKLAEFSKEENIVVYKENRFLKFSVGNYTTTYDVLEIIRTFIEENKHQSILFVEPKNDKYPYEYIPEEYWEIWKLERVLIIINKDCSIEEKIKMAYYGVIMEFYHPEEMDKFSLFGGGQVVGAKKMYKNMLKYADNKIYQLRIMNDQYAKGGYIG